MPGISVECETGQHAACAMGLECRCPHHAHTQELMRKGPNKGDSRGGIRRKLKGKITDAVQALPEVEAVPELKSLCPGCKAEQRGTDVFCRSCGARLQVGKQCFGCGAPQEPTDNYCWQCSLKCGEKPPEPAPQEEAPNEDRLIALAKKAREQGIDNPLIQRILKETVIP